MTRLTIGFLFNHAAAHQVAHILPIALALSRIAPRVTVELLVAGAAVEAEVRRLKAGEGPEPILLRPASRLARAVERASGGALPAGRVSVLDRNTDRFRDLDALVVPEKTSLLLKSRPGLSRLPIIHTRHGAGDRAIGFDRKSGMFDLVLVSGRKVRDRLQEKGLLRPGASAIVGYPKFDLLQSAPPLPVFGNGNPTVLYNPHPSPALSSWYAMGRQVLEWFACNPQFNLIFAPHVLLFAKRLNISLSPLSLGRPGKVPHEFAQYPNIRIDPGSPASVDMTYTRQADIYLGDASSQIYEFLVKPRPCVFLNPHRHRWSGNPDFAHWTAGAVVEDISAMEQALRQAVERPSAGRDIQQALFDYTFDLSPEPSSERAARAILEFLG